MDRKCASNEQLLQRFKQNDFWSPLVEKLFTLIPRSFFVPKELQNAAFDDQPLPIQSLGFNISAPHMHAFCLNTLDIQPGMAFLDVGSGCGHLTALGGYLVGSGGISHGLDLRNEIITFARNNVQQFSAQSNIKLNNVQFFARNVFLPTAELRLYDRIHVGACCPDNKFDEILKFLAPNGILITPYKNELLKITKNAKGLTDTKVLTNVSYGNLIVPTKEEIQKAQDQIIQVFLKQKEMATKKMTASPQSVPGTLPQIPDSEMEYDVFLSHYQKTGGHLALAIKSELLKVNPKWKIFLDVDDLNQIHDLSDNILHTRNIVLLLTEDVLARPFVLLEISTALKHKKNIIVVWDKERCGFPDVSKVDKSVKDVLVVKAIKWDNESYLRKAAVDEIVKQMNRGTTPPSSPAKQKVPVASWGVEEVCLALKELDLSQDYSALFRQQRIKGNAFLSMEESHLEKLGINIMGDRLDIMNKIKELRQ